MQSREIARSDLDSKMISGSDALLVGRIAWAKVGRRLYSDCGGESGDRRGLGQEMVRRWKGNSAPLGLMGRAPGEEVHPGGLFRRLGSGWAMLEDGQ